MQLQLIPARGRRVPHRGPGGAIPRAFLAWEYGPAPHWPVKVCLWRSQRCCCLPTPCRLSCFILIVRLLLAQLGCPSHSWSKETFWKCKVTSIHLRTNQRKALSKHELPFSRTMRPWAIACEREMTKVSEVLKKEHFGGLSILNSCV